MPRPIGRKVEGSKVDRMVAQSAKIEAGHVLLPKEADWLDTFLHELLAFPTGRHDDQVDSVSQFLKWSSSQRESVFDLTMIGTEVKVFVGGKQINRIGRRPIGAPSLPKMPSCVYRKPKPEHSGDEVRQGLGVN